VHGHGGQLRHHHGLRQQPERHARLWQRRDGGQPDRPDDGHALPLPHLGHLWWLHDADARRHLHPAMITLAQLEQEVARRAGPYYRFFADRQVPSTATFDYVNFPELRTNADLDLVTNLWMLRRGDCYDEPDEIVPMDPVDRQRTVSTYQAQAGRVFPDRPWAAIPESGEYMEFHHLNPEQELRPAVLAGLARCYMSDLVQASPTQQFGGIDLTVQYPWLTQPGQGHPVPCGWGGPPRPGPLP